MIREYKFATAQRALFPRYHAILVAGRFMKQEYVRGGAAEERVHAIPLFAPDVDEPGTGFSEEGAVLFIGRMTSAKGGDLLVRAIDEAQRLLGRRVPLVMAGEGPERMRWTTLARDLSVDAEFPGWIDRDAQRALLSRALVLAVPSTWPEPFGLVGLEAAACGVPSVAFDVGGISEWLRDGDTGLLAGDRPDAGALAATLVRVLSDRPLHARLSRGALQMARTLTLDRYVDAVERVLADARAVAGVHA
jgi:glycosyltransferase involved in cell wall biosynthesis